jgi:hypothetical protein
MPTVEFTTAMDGGSAENAGAILGACKAVRRTTHRDLSRKSQFKSGTPLNGSRLSNILNPNPDQTTPTPLI